MNEPLSPLLLPSAELDVPSTHEEEKDGFPAATSPGSVWFSLSPTTSNVDRPILLPGPSMGADHVPSHCYTATDTTPLPAVPPLLLGRGDMADQWRSIRPPSRLLASPRGSGPSQGSALETLSTLLLNHETHGKAAALSAAREGPTTASALSDQLSKPIRTLRGLGRRLSLQDHLTGSSGPGRLGTVSGMPTFEVCSPSTAGDAFGGPAGHHYSHVNEGSPSSPLGRNLRSQYHGSASSSPRNGPLSPSLPGAWVGSPSSPLLQDQPVPQPMTRKSSWSGQVRGSSPGSDKHERFDSTYLLATPLLF